MVSAGLWVWRTGQGQSMSPESEGRLPGGGDVPVPELQRPLLPGDRLGEWVMPPRQCPLQVLSLHPAASCPCASVTQRSVGTKDSFIWPLFLSVLPVWILGLPGDASCHHCPRSAEEMALVKLSDQRPLPMKTDGEEQQLARNTDNFLPVGSADSVQRVLQQISLYKLTITPSLLRGVTSMVQVLDRTADGEEIFSKDSPAAFLPEEETKQWATASLSCHLQGTEEFPSSRLGEELTAKQDQNLERDPDELETEETPQGDPRVSTSLHLSEENLRNLDQEMFLQLSRWDTQMNQQEKELGLEQADWTEKISTIIEKISLTENTVRSLLYEVMSLEGQIEKMDSCCDIDPPQGIGIQEKIREIKRLLEEMDMEFAQNFCQDMAVLNATLGLHEWQGEKTDSHSSGEESQEELEPLLAEAPAPLAEQDSGPHVAAWRCKMKALATFSLLAFFCLACYIFLFDATFVFERVLPTLLGRERTWELREMILPFLNLEVEDLLPS